MTTLSFAYPHPTLSVASIKGGAARSDSLWQRPEEEVRIRLGRKSLVVRISKSRKQKAEGTHNVVSLGDLATRFAPAQLEYDPVAGRILNHAEAAERLDPGYRQGWTL